MNSLGSSDSFCWKLNENSLINSNEIAFPTSGCCQNSLCNFMDRLHNTSSSSRITSLMWWLKNLLTCTMHCYSLLAETGYGVSCSHLMGLIATNPWDQVPASPNAWFSSGKCTSQIELKDWIGWYPNQVERLNRLVSQPSWKIKSAQAGVPNQVELERLNQLVKKLVESAACRCFPHKSDRDCTVANTY